MPSWTLLLILPLLSSLQNGQAVPNQYGLTHLLKPQVGFEINLIIPDSFSSAPFFPPPLLRSIEYLVDSQAPFRLYYNSSERPPPLIRTSWYAENQVTHVVFLMPQSKQEAIDIHSVFSSCVSRTNGFIFSVIHKDLIQVGLDRSTVDAPFVAVELGSFVPPPEFLPLYFIILDWSTAWFTFSEPVRVCETWECEDGPIPKFLGTHLGKISEINGIQVLKNEIRAEKIISFTAGY